MVQKKNPLLSKLLKELKTPPKPKKLVALRRNLTKKANKTQLKAKMHAIDDFKDASSMALSDKFPFGKYKDKTVRYIIKTDPMWLSWIMNNSEGRVRLCSEAMAQMATFMAAETADLEEGYQAELEEGEFGSIAIEDTY
jgi:hypothetical protein